MLPSTVEIRRLPRRDASLHRYTAKAAAVNATRVLDEQPLYAQYFRRVNFDTIVAQNLTQ